MKEFQNNERWLNGPSFLWKTEDHWPEIKHDEVAVDKLEIKKEVYLIQAETATPLDSLDNLAAIICLVTEVHEVAEAVFEGKET